MTKSEPERENIPEVSPELQIIEEEISYDVPIAVIDGALEELIREENEEGEYEVDIKPPHTIH